MRMPDCFKDLIDIDNRIRSNKVVQITDLKERRRRKRACQVFLQSQSKGGSSA